MHTHAFKCQYLLKTDSHNSVMEDRTKSSQIGMDFFYSLIKKKSLKLRDWLTQQLNKSSETRAFPFSHLTAGVR